MNIPFLPQWLTQFVIFGFVGVWNTLFDVVIWKLVAFLLGSRTPEAAFLNKNRYSIAQFVSFVSANIVSYFLNRYLTFSDSKVGDSPETIFRYFIVSVFALGVSIAMINFLTKNKYILKNISSLQKKLTFVDHIFAFLPIKIKRMVDWPLIAKLITVIVTLLINFVGYKLWVFF